MKTFVDYAWWQVSPAQLETMGFSGAMRYGTPRNSKSMTPPEVANLRAAGFDIGDVFESTGSRAGEGFQAGHDDAVGANAYADTLGYPATCTLFYAVDFDASPSAVQAYFDGIASVGARPEAPYGSAAVVDGVRYHAPYGWQTAAWSRGQVSKRAGLLQNGFHGTYDSNLVLVDDFGQWRAGQPAPPVDVDDGQVIQEDDMLQVNVPAGQRRALLLSEVGAGSVLLASVEGGPVNPAEHGHLWIEDDAAVLLADVQVVFDNTKKTGTACPKNAAIAVFENDGHQPVVMAYVPSA